MAINEERCRAVAAAIRANVDRFHMKDYGAPFDDLPTHPCGTPACIAGFTIAIVDPDGDNRERRGSQVISDIAGEMLGISYWQVASLFAPIMKYGGKWCFRRNPGQSGHITAEHAARCLERLADTGEVDWEGTAP